MKMPRTYKPKEGAKKRIPIDKVKLELAVKEILKGNTVKGTAKLYGVPLMTLKRYARKQQKQPDIKISYEPDYKQSRVFTEEEEAELANYCEKASKLHHGLNSMSVRRLAFQFAVENNKPADKISKWTNNMASSDWFYGFMRRNPQLSLQVPKATSLSRSTSFNRHNISKFFETLRSLLDRYNFSPEATWNVDETGLTTVHKPKKVVATKGVKQVGKMTSGERGKLVTACCAINAMGNHIPPYMIFPRKYWQDRMLIGAPTGTDGNTFPSGWMTAENFVNFLKHFKKYSKCSLEFPMLIIMDNHDSHISIDSLNFAKKNGIHLLTIPPHTSHKTQPLDRTVYGPLKAYYNNACDNWMLQNPGKVITIYDISELLGHAFPRAFTPQNIQSGFRVTGIFPFNNEIFSDEEFLSSYVTDRPFTEEPEANLESAINLINESDSDSAVLDSKSPPPAMSGSGHEFFSPCSPQPSTSAALGMNLTSSSPRPSTSAALGMNLTSSSPQPSTSAAPDNIEIIPEPSSPSLLEDLSNSIEPLRVALEVTPVKTQRDVPHSPKADIEMNISSDLSTSNKHLPKFKTPEQIQPFPKAGYRKPTQKGRKRGSTKILTDTPEKNQIEEEILLRKKKKPQKTVNKAKTTKVKRNLKAFEPSSDEKEYEIPPSPESTYDVSEDEDHFSSSSCESENENSIPPETNDWVVVNFVSMKNLIHRYVGQIQSVTDTGYIVKFAKKINDSKFRWPVNNDISEIARYQVVGKIRPPEFKANSKRVISFTFKKSLRKFNIKG